MHTMFKLRILTKILTTDNFGAFPSLRPCKFQKAFRTCFALSEPVRDILVMLAHEVAACIFLSYNMCVLSTTLSASFAVAH